MSDGQSELYRSFASKKSYIHMFQKTSFKVGNLKGPYHGGVKLFIEFLELTARLVKCSKSSSKSPRVW